MKNYLPFAKKILQLGTVAAALTVWALPSFAQSAGMAMVRVIHASADAPAVDVLYDGSLAFQGLRFRDYTNYTPVPAGSHTISVNVSGTTTTVMQYPVTLMAGSTYSFYAFGRLKDPMGNTTLVLIGTGDDPTPPAANSVKVRVMHGASLAPAVDVYATAPFAALGMPLLTGVPFTLASDYLTVPAGDYQARVTVAGTKTVAINSGRLRLTGGTVRTIVAVDPVKPGDPFDFLILNDAN